MAQDEQAEMVRRILDDLEREQESRPAISYEVRSERDRNDVPRKLSFDAKDEVLADQDADAWRTACMTADLMSGQLACTVSIWQVRTFTNLRGDVTRTEESYVVSSCGGSQHWTEGDGLHQVSSAGFCWTCLHPDYDLDQVPHGLIRHPVTPDEIGQPAYRCFVCGVEGGDPDSGHEDVDHTVIWGEKNHPRCGLCGLSYQTATPQGIGYREHADDCPALDPEWRG